MAANSTYGAAEREIRELFADYLDGGASNPGLAVGMHPLSPEVRNAISKTFEAFGYESTACTFASLTLLDANAEGGDIALDPQALFVLVEGLDPLYVIAADAASTEMLGKAYRTNYVLDTPNRVFGRPSAAFSDLQTLLQTPEGKQKAWRVLKALQA